MKTTVDLPFEGLVLFITGDYLREEPGEANAAFELEKVTLKDGSDLTSLLDGLRLPFVRGSGHVIPFLDELETLALEKLLEEPPELPAPPTKRNDDFRDAYEQVEAHFHHGAFNLWLP